MSQVNPNLTKTPDARTSEGRRELLETIIETRDRDLLWEWIYFTFGLAIPRKRICADHDAPFDFVADYIFGDIYFAIVLANRSGGKTMNFGVLDTIMSWLKPNTEVATVGAIQSQAQKCYSYFLEFSAKFPFSQHIVSPTMNKTTMDNNSSVQVLTGTMSGVNSPHPQLVFLDEIDLMVWSVLQQAFSMAQSNKQTRARTVVTSTRKFATGPMQRMMNDAPKKKHKVYQWCIWEVVEALPVDNPEIMQRIQEVFGNELPEGIDEAQGYYMWEDLIIKRDTLDEETWETEWLCKRPGLQGVIYGTSYSDNENLITNEAWTPKGRPGYIFLAEDFGFTEGHPNAILFCWVPPEFDRLVVFDELYLTGHDTQQIWDEIDAKLRTYGHNLPNRLAKLKGTVRGWVGDYHGTTEIADRQSRGAPMLEKEEDPKLYEVANGISLVRKMFHSGRLMIHIRCVNLRLEVMSYRFKKNIDGTYSPNPVKADDHGPDALRYLIIKLYKLIMGKVNATIARDLKERLPATEPATQTPRKRLRSKQGNPLTFDGEKPIGMSLNDENWR